MGKKLKKKGIDGATRLPDVAPASKCLLRKLKLERVKDWLLMEEEFVTNQERIKPHTERAADDQSKVDELRGSPMSVGNLEEIIDDKYAPARVQPRPHVESLAPSKIWGPDPTPQPPLARFLSVFFPRPAALTPTPSTSIHAVTRSCRRRSGPSTT